MSPEEPREPHPVCKQLRAIRRSANLSLPEAEQKCGVPGIVLGSWERGDRNPPLHKLEDALNSYGYTLVAVPKDFDAVRLSSSIVNDLREIANQLEKKEKHVS